MRGGGENNISEKNPYYCELTAQYWAWKNLKTDICGLVHYRRFFMDYQSTSLKPKEDILRKNKITEILQKYDVILSFKRTKGPRTGVYYTNIADEKQDFHWRILYKIIKNKYPEYEKSFNTVMSKKFYSPCNMFIAKKEVFDRYSEWLFTILNEYDITLEEWGMDRIPRVDGFLSECLLNIFFLFNFDKSKIYRLDVMNIELSENYKYHKVLRTNYLILKSIELIRSILKYIVNIPQYYKYKKGMR